MATKPRILLAATAASLLAVAGCGSSGHHATAAGKASTGASSSTPALPTPSAPAFVERAVRIGDSPVETTVAFGSLWVTDHRDGTLTRLDPMSGKVTARIQSPGDDLVGLAAAAGHVWYLDASKQVIEAVDATTNKLDTSIAVNADGGALAPAPDGIWFTGTDGKLTHVTPSGVAGAVKVAKGSAGLSPWQSGNHVWVADADDGTLTEFDTSLKRVRQVKIGGDPFALADGPGGMWVGNGSGALRLVDPASGAVRKTFRLKAVAALATCGGKFWVRVADAKVVAIDPSSGTVLKHYTLPRSEIPGGGIACADNALWVANWTNGTVWQLPTI